MYVSQVTGGGGYTKENVARCWTVETGALVDTELANGKYKSTVEVGHKLLQWFMIC